MSSSGSTIVLPGIFIGLSLIHIAKALSRKHFPFDSYLYYTWIFFLCFTIAEFVSFSVGIWVLAIPYFTALREYFSLIDIRLQDRSGILGAQISIPFMIYFIQIEWFNMFIISIPVYSFLAIPLLVTLGGKEKQGTVFSIGIIDFGLFLFVYCLGHIGYLVLFSTWMAVMLVINVAVCDVIACIVRNKMSTRWKHFFLQYFITIPFTISILLILSVWTGIPAVHSVLLGLLIPVLVIMGQHTIDYVKVDLGIEEDLLLPGRGQILDNIKSLFYTAPIVFHYYKYFFV